MKKSNIKKWLKDRIEMLCRSMIVLCILLSLLQGVSASSSLINYAKIGNLDQVKAVVSQGKENINVQDKDGNTALIWAAKKGHTAIVEYLCRQGKIDITIKNNDNETALILIACMEDDQLDLVMSLCQKVNTPAEYINWEDDYGYTALTAANFNKNNNTRDYLIKHENIDKNINFISAAITDQLELVKLLLKTYKNNDDFDINGIDKNGYTALTAAVAYNEDKGQKIKNYLLNEGKFDKNINFISAARTGQLDLVKELLTKYANDAGFDINAVDKDGNTALIWAARNGYIKVVQYLQQNGINLNLQDNNNNTALIWAAKNGHTAIVQYLCEQGNIIDITIKNNKNETALIWVACMDKDQVNLVTSLCEKNNKPEYINWQDDDGYTALTVAYNKENKNVKNYLLNHENSDKNITFISAARIGQLEFMKLLLKDYHDDINIDAKDKDGNTALIWAAKKGHTAIVEYLCGQGKINITIKNNNNETALIWGACMKNDQVNLVRSLCEKNNKPEYINWQDDDGYTALTVAYNKENKNVKNYLLNHENSDKNITFISAARIGQLEFMKLLLKDYRDDINIDAKDKYGNTALIWAAIKGHTAIVEYLCGQGNINITIKNNKNETALIWVACMKNDQVNLVRSLCEKNNTPEYINWQDDEGNTALICAAMSGNMKIVKYLCQQEDINLNLQDKKGNTALICAARNGHIDIVKYLCDQPNINIKAQDKYGDTAVTWAAYNGHIEIVKFLCEEKGIDINTKGEGGKTVLICAARNGHIDIVKYLCDQPNINIKAQDKYGDTAVTWAAYNGHIEIVKFLCEEKGIDINTKGEGGKTVLICAAIKGHVGIIDYLCNLPKIEPNLQDNQGNTAFSWTAYNGHENCIDSLRKYSDIDPKIANYAGNTPIHRAAKGAKKLIAKDYKSTYKKLIDAGIDTQQENNNGEKAIDLVEDNELKSILREYVPKKTDSTDIDNNDSTDNSDKSDSDNINADRTPEEKSYTGTVVFIALLLTTGSLIAATLFFWPKNDTKSKKDTVHGATHNSKNKDEKPKNSSIPKAIQVA